jgi:ABC-type bacteriocin/lantibiotic exporter with double-glycine peptidase domain
MILWFAQEHPASCVAACLRMVLASFGQQRSESEIRHLLGNPRFGITLTQAADRLLAAGAVAQWHTDWGVDDLRACLRHGDYPIVGIERRFFGYPSATHAVVVTTVRNADVEMLDPLLGPAPHVTQLDTFATAWQSAGQEALALLSPLPA